MNNNDDLDMTYPEGYELAQTKFNQLTKSPQTSEEWVEFFQGLTWNIYDMHGVCGVAGFITSQEAKNINVGQFSKELKSLEKSSEQYGHDSRMVDRSYPTIVFGRVGSRSSYGKFPSTLLPMQIVAHI